MDQRKKSKQITRLMVGSKKLTNTDGDNCLATIRISFLGEKELHF